MEDPYEVFLSQYFSPNHTWKIRARNFFHDISHRITRGRSIRGISFTIFLTESHVEDPCEEFLSRYFSPNHTWKIRARYFFHNISHRITRGRSVRGISFTIFLTESHVEDPYEVFLSQYFSPNHTWKIRARYFFHNISHRITRGKSVRGISFTIFLTESHVEDPYEVFLSQYFSPNHTWKIRARYFFHNISHRITRGRSVRGISFTIFLTESHVENPCEVFLSQYFSPNHTWKVRARYFFHNISHRITRGRSVRGISFTIFLTESHVENPCEVFLSQYFSPNHTWKIRTRYFFHNISHRITRGRSVRGISFTIFLTESHVEGPCEVFLSQYFSPNHTWKIRARYFFHNISHRITRGRSVRGISFTIFLTESHVEGPCEVFLSQYFSPNHTWKIRTRYFFHNISHRITRGRSVRGISFTIFLTESHVEGPCEVFLSQYFSPNHTWKVRARYFFHNISHRITRGRSVRGISFTIFLTESHVEGPCEVFLSQYFSPNHTWKVRARYFFHNISHRITRGRSVRGISFTIFLTESHVEGPCEVFLSQYFSPNHTWKIRARYFFHNISHRITRGRSVRGISFTIFLTESHVEDPCEVFLSQYFSPNHTWKVRARYFFHNISHRITRGRSVRGISFTIFLTESHVEGPCEVFLSQYFSPNHTWKIRARYFFHNISHRITRGRSVRGISFTIFLTESHVEDPCEEFLSQYFSPNHTWKIRARNFFHNISHRITRGRSVRGISFTIFLTESHVEGPCEVFLSQYFSPNHTWKIRTRYFFHNISHRITRGRSVRGISFTIFLTESHVEGPCEVFQLVDQSDDEDVFVYILWFILLELNMDRSCFN